MKLIFTILVIVSTSFVLGTQFSKNFGKAAATKTVSLFNPACKTKLVGGKFSCG